MGEAGLSPAEVGKEIGEHRRHHGVEEGGLRWVAIAEAVLLAVVAVMAAWTGYASAKWTTESRLLLAQANTARTEANRALLDADEQRNFDEESFAVWFTAYASGDPATLDLDHRVVATLGVGDPEGQADLRLVDGVAEVLVERATVDDDLALTGQESDASDGRLAAARPGVEGRGGHGSVLLVRRAAQAAAPDGGVPPRRRP